MKKLFWFAVSVAGMIAMLQLLGYDVTVGGHVLSRDMLERQHQRGYRKSRIVVGGCTISRDVDARMLTEVIPSLFVVGGIVAPKAVAEAYGSDLKVIGGAMFRDSPLSSEH
jgi:hypothetical protein